MTRPGSLPSLQSTQSTVRCRRGNHQGLPSGHNHGGRWRTRIPVLELLEDRTAPAATPWMVGSDTPAYPSPMQFVGTDDVALAMERSGPLIGLNQLWQSSDPNSLFKNINGNGFGTSGRIGVAILDTGIDDDHPALTNLTGGRDVSGTFSSGDSNFDDLDGHGSHVAGIIGGQPYTSTAGYAFPGGVAPGVQLVGVKVFDDNRTAYFSWIERGLQWVINNAATFNIKVVNMSLSDGGNYAYGSSGLSILNNEIATLENMGITVVAAAGNSYYRFQTSGSGYPAVVATLAAGAVWSGNFGRASWSSGAVDNSSSVDRVVSFSQRDASHPGFLMSPGAIITSTIPQELDGNGDGFASGAGTSMASPHVAGVVALVQDAALTFGNRYLSPDEVTEILRDSAEAVYDGDNEDDNVTNTNTTYYRIDAYAAVQAVYDMFQGTPVLDVAISSVSAPTSTVGGNTVQVSVTVRNSGNTAAGPFDVTLMDQFDSVAIATQTVTSLAAGASTALTFTWNTTGEGFGNHVLVASHNQSGDANGGNNTASATVTVQDPSQPPATIFYFSVLQNWQLPGTSIVADNDDVIAYNTATGQFSLYFNGTPWLTDNFGSLTIDGLAIKSDTEILLSFAEDGGIIQNGSTLFIDDSDIVLFRHSAGNTTTGTFEIFFDGSLYGLSSSNEDVDGFELLDNGNLLISTVGGFAVTGVSGNDEDILQFNSTSKTWSLYFDGSNRGLSGSSEDIDGVALFDGKLQLSAEGTFSVTGVSGQDEDVFVFNIQTGSYQSQLFFDGSAFGLGANDIVGIDIRLQSAGTSSTTGAIEDPTTSVAVPAQPLGRHVTPGLVLLTLPPAARTGAFIALLPAAALASPAVGSAAADASTRLFASRAATHEAAQYSVNYGAARIDELLRQVPQNDQTDDPDIESPAGGRSDDERRTARRSDLDATSRHDALPVLPLPDQFQGAHSLIDLRLEELSTLSALDDTAVAASSWQAPGDTAAHLLAVALLWNSWGVATRHSDEPQGSRAARRIA